MGKIRFIHSSGGVYYYYQFIYLLIYLKQRRIGVGAQAAPASKTKTTQRQHPDQKPGCCPASFVLSTKKKKWWVSCNTQKQGSDCKPGIDAVPTACVENSASDGLEAASDSLSR